MIKSRGTHGRASVVFTLDPAVGAHAASVCGEWNAWASDAHPMARAADGSFSVTVELEAGRAYRFRYLLDRERWENDWAADAYVPNGFGGEDSVVDLTALAADVTPTAPPTAPPAAPARSNKAAKSAAAATKKAAEKAATEKSDAAKPSKKRTKKAAD